MLIGDAIVEALKLFASQQITESALASSGRANYNESLHVVVGVVFIDLLKNVVLGVGAQHELCDEPAQKINRIHA